MVPRITSRACEDLMFLIEEKAAELNRSPTGTTQGADRKVWI
jgi:hypothetical protein